MKYIVLECCGQFVIYGHPEIFLFYCSRHCSSLQFWKRNGVANILHSREGVTQGGSLSMFACGIGVIQLIKNLKAEHPDFTQPWYTDNLIALETFGNIELYFNFNS